MAVRVLLVDDEAPFRETLEKVLRARGFHVRGAGTGEAGLRALAEEAADVVVLDLRMPGLDGLATLERIAAGHPGTRVVILTGHGTVGSGLDAMRKLAFDFLLKPAPVEQLVRVIQAAAATPPGAG